MKVKNIKNIKIKEKKTLTVDETLKKTKTDMKKRINLIDMNHIKILKFPIIPTNADWNAPY